MSKVLAGRNPGALARGTQGVVPALRDGKPASRGDVAGYRCHAVYLRTSRYAPRREAARDAMPVVRRLNDNRHPTDPDCFCPFAIRESANSHCGLQVNSGGAGALSLTRRFALVFEVTVHYFSVCA